MLDYGLPDAPKGHRWFIEPGKYDKAKRYLVLEKKKSFLGFKWWSTVREEVILTGPDFIFQDEVRRDAHRILNNINVNLYLPTGEVI